VKKLKIISLIFTIMVSLFSTNFIPKNNEEGVLSDSTFIMAKEETTTEEKSNIIVEEEIQEIEVEQPKPKVGNKPTTTTTSTSNVNTSSVSESNTVKESKPISNDPIYRTDISASYESQINAYRVSKGLSALPITDEAKSEANMRAMQLVSNYSHNSSYSFGENIGNGTAGVDFVTAWKNSPGHNATLLREEAIAFAVSIVEYNGRWYAVSSFMMDYSMFGE